MRVSFGAPTRINDVVSVHDAATLSTDDLHASIAVDVQFIVGTESLALRDVPLLGLAAEIAEAAAMLRDGSAACALSVYGDYELYFPLDSSDVAIDERLSKRELRVGADEFFRACDVFMRAAFEAVIASMPSIADNVSFVALRQRCLGEGQG